jgi:hypothetical protein
MRCSDKRDVEAELGVQARSLTEVDRGNGYWYEAKSSLLMNVMVRVGGK